MASTPEKQKALEIALVGGETLLGQELQEALKSNATGARITAYPATGEGNFGEEDGEAIYHEPLEAKSLLGVTAVVLAGTPEGAAKAYALVKSAGGKPRLIDCTGELDHRPEARIIGAQLDQRADAKSWLLVLAHPAAGALALVLERLSKYKPIHRAVIHIFEPASELGKTAVTELHQQTVNLLAFKPIPKKVFDAQLAFNLLPAYGEDAPHQIAQTERRIETHLATLLNRRKETPLIPMPSLRVVQAPVYHGYSISAWIEFETNVEATALGEELASAQIEVRGKTDEPPSSVGAAGQSGLIAGDMRIDRNNARAAWLWIVADNLRLTADAAANLIRQLAGVGE